MGSEPEIECGEIHIHECTRVRKSGCIAEAPSLACESSNRIVVAAEWLDQVYSGSEEA